MTLQQRTPEWIEARRSLITSTDIPVLMGLSPYKSEATLAREKMGEAEPRKSLLMDIGTALEPVIGAEYERITNTKLRRFHGIVRHPKIDWAAASPDWRRQGARYLVEGKRSQSKRWDGDELPQDIEAQLRWALGCTGYAIGDVAALMYWSDLRIYTIEHDQQTFNDLVAVAEDFRHRLTTDGPFAEDAASVKAKYPADDGTELIADEELTEAITELLRLRAQRAEVDEACDRLETAVKARMATATRLIGPGWSVSWKKSKDSELTDWRLIADGLLRQLPTDQRDALVGLYTTVREGFRPFRVTVEKGARQ